MIGAKGARAQDLPHLTVAGPPIDDFKTVYYANAAGIFRRYGISVDINPLQSGAAALAALAGGSVQVAFTSVPSFLQAYSRGLAVRIVAPAQWYISDNATNALFVRADSSVKSGADLNGKTVAVQSIRDLNWAATMAWIDQSGGDSRTVKVIELPVSAVIPAIEDGRIDAGSVGTPFIEAGLASGKVRQLAKNYDAIAKRFQASAFVATAEYIDANHDTMVRFLRAMHESIVYTNAHLPETVDLVATFTGAGPASVAKSVRAIDPEYVDPANIQPVIDVAVKYKLIDRPIVAADVVASVALKPPMR